MRRLSQTIPINLVKAKAIPDTAQLGVPVDASLPYTSAIFDLSDWLSGTFNLLLAGGTATIGAMYLDVANDVSPSFAEAPDFQPIGWAELTHLTFAANGALMSAVLPLEYGWGRFRWVPNGETTGTIQGAIRLTGRP